MARRAGAEVALIRVYSALQAAYDPERLGRRGGRCLVEPLRGYLDGLARRLAAGHPVRVRPLSVTGYCPEGVIGAVAGWDGSISPDLIVTAAHDPEHHTD